MVEFRATIKKFGQQGEKTGWTYIEIPAGIAEEIKPGNKKSFRVKGKLDHYAIEHISLLPMGGGNFIMALNAEMRKTIRKKNGAMVTVQLSEDKKGFVFNKDFMDCLDDDPPAKQFFQTLPGSHQRYFSKWIESAKTEPTRVKRITMAVNALAKAKGFNEMLKAERENSKTGK